MNIKKLLVIKSIFKIPAPTIAQLKWFTDSGRVSRLAFVSLFLSLFRIFQRFQNCDFILFGSSLWVTGHRLLEASRVNMENHDSMVFRFSFCLVYRMGSTYLDRCSCPFRSRTLRCPKSERIRDLVFRLNANPLPIPYHRSRPAESNRLSNGNMVMIPPGSPRKTAGNKYGSDKSRQQQQQQPYKNASKTDITCKLLTTNVGWKKNRNSRKYRSTSLACRLPRLRSRAKFRRIRSSRIRWWHRDREVETYFSVRMVAGTIWRVAREIFSRERP